MFCPKCGKENKNDAEFCLECGTSLQGKNNKALINLLNAKKMTVVMIILVLFGLGLILKFHNDIDIVWSDYRRPSISTIVGKQFFDFGDIRWKMSIDDFLKDHGATVEENKDSNVQRALINAKGKKICSVDLVDNVSYDFYSSLNMKGLRSIRLDVYKRKIEDIDKKLYEAYHEGDGEKGLKNLGEKASILSQMKDAMEPDRKQARIVREQLIRDLNSLYGLPYKEDDINVENHRPEVRWMIDNDTEIALHYIDTEQKQNVYVNLRYKGR